MSNEYNKLEVCPYNPNHVMKSSRIQYHIAKCEKNYPTWVACHYNHCHRMPADKLAAHLPVCPNRKIMNWNHDKTPMHPSYPVPDSVADDISAWNLNFEDWTKG